MRCGSWGCLGIVRTPVDTSDGKRRPPRTRENGRASSIACAAFVEPVRPAAKSLRSESSPDGTASPVTRMISTKSFKALKTTVGDTSVDA